MADVQLLSELPPDRRRELARRQVAALAMRRAPSKRARQALAAALPEAPAEGTTGPGADPRPERPA
jgi:hypothetical protein